MGANRAPEPLVSSTPGSHPRYPHLPLTGLRPHHISLCSMSRISHPSAHPAAKDSQQPGYTMSITSCLVSTSSFPKPSPLLSNTTVRASFLHAAGATSLPALTPLARYVGADELVPPPSSLCSLPASLCALWPQQALQHSWDLSGSFMLLSCPIYLVPLPGQRCWPNTLLFFKFPDQGLNPDSLQGKH